MPVTPSYPGVYIPASILKKSPVAAKQPSVYAHAATYCRDRRAFLIVDPPVAWQGHAEQGEWDQIQPADLGIPIDDRARNAAVYFPRIIQTDPRTQDETAVFPPCGHIAGVMVRTDHQIGVWRAPAGVEL